MSQELIKFFCEQCGRTGVKKYEIDNTVVCTNCYRQLKGYRHYKNRLLNNFGPIYQIPILREIRMKETTMIKAATKERTLQYHKDYRKEHWIELSKKSVDNKRRWKKLWNSTNPKSQYLPVVVNSERYVCEVVLPKLDFTDIFWITMEKRGFLCDIIAKDKYGCECAFDVKLSVYTDIRESKMKIIKRLGWRFFVVHVLPDLSFYHINELINSRSSSAILPFKKFLQQKV